MKATQTRVTATHYFIKASISSLINLTARKIWHVCFHPCVFYKVLIRMLKLKALYKVFGLSGTIVFPGRRAQGALLRP